MPRPSQSSEPPPPPPTAPPDSTFQTVLSRPEDQRRREHQYRFGQTVVFGLPVLALQWFGRRLGGDEAGRWVGLLQALLAGWVVYVAAAGMLAEGVMRLGLPAAKASANGGRRVWADALVACVAAGLYVWSLGRLVLAVVATRQAAPPPRLFFHWVVLLLGVWTGLRWFGLTKRMRAAQGGSQAADDSH